MISAIIEQAIFFGAKGEADIALSPVYIVFLVLIFIASSVTFGIMAYKRKVKSIREKAEKDKNSGEGGQK